MIKYCKEIEIDPCLMFNQMAYTEGIHIRLLWLFRSVKQGVACTLEIVDEVSHHILLGAP